VKTKTTSHHGSGVERFLAQHGTDVTGVISGFDRLRLRGSLRYFYQPTFLLRHLCSVGVLLKNFGAYATSLSDRVRDAAHAFARRCDRPVALPFLDRWEQGDAGPPARRPGAGGQGAG
jgi:hypothetical protein